MHWWLIGVASALWATVAANPVQTEVPVGRVVPSVTCAEDATQTYAAYLPSSYSTSREWPVILGFDPGGRGGNPVERYREAAERYGYIVVGSNNSRNGSPDIERAVNVMTHDVLARFRIDAKRVYAAGMSGGSRVALAMALLNRGFAGVFASSAGFPDGVTRKSLPFAVFGTAGTEDFNHLEMRLLDRELESPHRLAIFQGGHTWLPPALAMEGVEWMELQAMLTGAKPRDERSIDSLLARRVATAEALTVPVERYRALSALVADFRGLRDVSTIAARLPLLAREKAVKDALKRERDEDDRELGLLRDMARQEQLLASPDARSDALGELSRTWHGLLKDAASTVDSANRRIARRLIAGRRASGVPQDADYAAIVRQLGMTRPGR